MLPEIGKYCSDSNPLSCNWGLNIFVLFQHSQANRDHEAVVKQNEFISKDLAGEERLQKALNEISDLTKKLCEQKTEFDDKVKSEVVYIQVENSDFIRWSDYLKPLCFQNVRP